MKTLIFVISALLSGLLLLSSNAVIAKGFYAKWSVMHAWVKNDNTSIRPYCGALAHCNCNGMNLCGKYYHGQSTYWWPQGCNQSPQRITYHTKSYN